MKNAGACRSGVIGRLTIVVVGGEAILGIRAPAGLVISTLGRKCGRLVATNAAPICSAAGEVRRYTAIRAGGPGHSGGRVGRAISCEF